MCEVYGKSHFWPGGYSRRFTFGVRLKIKAPLPAAFEQSTTQLHLGGPARLIQWGCNNRDGERRQRNKDEKDSQSSG